MNRNWTVHIVKALLLSGVILVAGIGFSGCGMGSWNHSRHHGAGHHAESDTESRSMQGRPGRHGERRQRRMRRGTSDGSDTKTNANVSTDDSLKTSEEPDTSGRTDSAKTESEDRPDVPSASEELVRLGKETYEQNCASCHGAEREGSTFAYPALKNLSGRLSREKTREIIEAGPGSMPSFTGLSEKKKDALVTFLFDYEE